MSPADPTAFARLAWLRDFPGLTAEEFEVLFPIVENRRGWIRAVIDAYRAGVEKGTPKPEPVGGYAPCPVCDGAWPIAAVGWDGAGESRVMFARCACGTFYRVDTGDRYTPTLSPVHYTPTEVEP